MSNLLKTLLIMCLFFISCNPEFLEQLEKCQPRVNIWEEGIIPFKFNDNVPEYHRDLVYQTISFYESNTPLQFIEYTEDDFYTLEHGVLIKYTGAVQSSYYPYGQGDYISDLRLGSADFLELRTVMHEFGHVVGLPHEHERADRDEYVIIHWDNIPDEWEGNYTLSDIEFITTYDPLSIMGYPNTIAIDQSKLTVEMIDGREIVPSDLPTKLDLEKINELYCYETTLKEE